MNNLAIAFLTKDRVDLSTRTVRPLIQPDKLDLYFIDGSTTEEGAAFPYKIMLEQPESLLGHHMFKHGCITGGPDRAIVYALTQMLKGNYSYVGLVEQDVLLHPDWLGPTRALFKNRLAIGLPVGAVSSRAYEDRVLIQRDGYAVMHNLGAGMVIFTRQAAKLVLENYRTGWWPDNRRIFAQLSGLDIGKWGAFRGNEQAVTADWHFDTILAANGYASLALTPCLADMIGQPMPLADMGLHLVTEPVEQLRNDEAFATYRDRLVEICSENLFATSGDPILYDPNHGSFTIFPHHFAKLNSNQNDKWRTRWSQGFGPFSWVAAEPGAQLDLWVSGPCLVIVGGGERGGRVHVLDTASRYEVAPALPPEAPGHAWHQLVIPCGGAAYRIIRITAEPGTTIYALVTKERQPVRHAPFDYFSLPLVWEPAK